MSKQESDFVCEIPVENGATYNTKSANEIVQSVRAAFDTGVSKSVKFRREQLKSLCRMLQENTEEFVVALNQDLGRSRHESLTYDIEFSINEIKRILIKLNDWVKPKYPSKPLPFMLDVVKVVHDPYGVVLILGSWNYPLTVLLTPLAGAIAGGNCTIIKPSEIATATANLLANLLPKYLDVNCYQVYLGAGEETSLLLEQRFDYIFFTGSTRVGRIVHSSANKYLTPVTLEMGGKSPAYIDNTVDMQTTVRRILWGKCANAGQTCISPDYVLCSEEVQKKFLPIAKQVISEWYGDDVKASPSFSRIISDLHYNRLSGFLNNKNNIAVGGKTDALKRFIEPTILINVSPNHPVMLEEIFGPILPIIIVRDTNEAVSFINAREKPLAIYIFTKSKSVQNVFIEKTSSGTVGINDTFVQFGVSVLPFGGVGLSGMGQYHGDETFNTFVHNKSVYQKTFNPLLEKAQSLRYPPYSAFNTKILNFLLRTRHEMCFDWFKHLFAFILGIIFMICLQVIYYNVTKKSLL